MQNKKEESLDYLYFARREVEVPAVRVFYEKLTKRLARITASLGRLLFWVPVFALFEVGLFAVIVALTSAVWLGLKIAFSLLDSRAESIKAIELLLDLRHDITWENPTILLIAGLITIVANKTYFNDLFDSFIGFFLWLGRKFGLTKRHF